MHYKGKQLTPLREKRCYIRDLAMKPTPAGRPFCIQYRPSVRILDMAISLILLVLSFPGQGQSPSLSFQALSYSQIDRDFTAPRHPSFYAPRDREIIIPLDFEVPWNQENVLLEDDRDVLLNIKKTTKSWDQEEYFIEFWRLEDTGIYKPVPLKEKKSYLEKNMLRYADKRLAGEIKKSKEGTTLHKMGKVQKTLRPQTKIQLSPLYRIRLRAKVLRGLIMLKLENPYIDETQLEFKALNKASFWDKKSYVGRAKLHLKQPFGENNLYLSHIEYRFYEGRWKWQIQREFKEVAPGLAIEFSAEQNHGQSPLNRASDKTGRFIYEITF